MNYIFDHMHSNMETRHHHVDKGNFIDYDRASEVLQGYILWIIQGQEGLASTDLVVCVAGEHAVPWSLVKMDFK